MKNVKIEIEHAAYFAGEDKYKALQQEAAAAIEKLEKGTGMGSDFVGWVNLPKEITEDELSDIEATAKGLREACDYVVCVGIGGSYLGAKAVIEALQDQFSAYKKIDSDKTHVIFAGQNIGEDYLTELQRLLNGKKFGIIVISKSGTTTEPAIAFRLLRAQLEKQVGKEEAKKLIVAVTDAKKGALRTMADTEGWKTYVIPDNVGGRFSVLTPVGLLPIAVAGFSVRNLVAGACEMMEATRCSGSDNPAETYACVRNALYQAGKKTEILANFNPKLHYLSEWWKQLYGESEGKESKGIFPAAVDLTTDLHSMGQYIQQGERTLFETVLSVESPLSELRIPQEDADLDGLNYIAGKRIDEVNKMAEAGTRLAHEDGGVPVIRISVPTLNEHVLGSLIYFFEKACGISGYLLGVNPFDQPGVEAYKKNMFALLGKPGYEAAGEELRKRL